MPITREQFTRALYQGLGRPITYALANDTRMFFDVIVEYCCYNPLYDRQAGVDRAPYLHELIVATGAEAFFRSQILAALADPDPEMDEDLLFDLALGFAQAGDSGARRAMHARFLDNVSSGDTAGAYQLVTLDGTPGLRVVIEQIGAALGRAVSFEASWLPEGLLDKLERAYADAPAVLADPRVATFRAAVRGSAAEQAAHVDRNVRRRQLSDALPTLTYAEVREAEQANLLAVTQLRRWGQQASAAELQRAADDLLVTADIQLQQRLLMIFDKRDFPNSYEPLLALLERPEYLLSLRAAHALARFSHPDLRARALALLTGANTFEQGLSLLVGNYAPGDYAMLATIAQEQADDDALHALVWRAHELFALHPAPEAAALLLALYERGPCAQCREKVVADLISLSALPAALVGECRYDANEVIRALVADLPG